MDRNSEAMLEMADNLWNGFFRAKVKEMLGSYLSYYRAKVIEAPSNGTVTVQEPFDHEHVIFCASSASGLQVGDECLVLMFGGPQNSIVIGNGTLS